MVRLWLNRRPVQDILSIEDDIFPANRTQMFKQIVQRHLNADVLMLRLTHHFDCKSPATEQVPGTFTKYVTWRSMRPLAGCEEVPGTCGSTLHPREDSIDHPHADGFGLGQLRFEDVALRQQFVHFGDDAFLFGKGWEGNEG